MDRVERMGIDFRLALLGETSQVKPGAFLDSRSRFGERIVHYGYVSDREHYVQWLKKGCVAVSTAIQENFGIAAVEAMRHGCLPLLPRRLSYPEILPKNFTAYSCTRTMRIWHPSWPRSCAIPNVSPTTGRCLPT